MAVRGLVAAAVAAMLAVALVGCDASGGGRADQAGSGQVQVELQTHAQWSEGSTRLYAIVGAGWPPSGLQRAAWQESASYSVEPALAVKSARLLDDGVTVCLATTDQVSGAAYQVRYTPKVAFPASPLEGFPQSRVLTAVAVDATHVVVVPDIHHLERADWADAATYRIEPSLTIQSVQQSADRRLVRLTTAQQNTTASYKLLVGGSSTAVVR